MVEEVGELAEKLEVVLFPDRELASNIQVHILKSRHAELGHVCWCVSVPILIEAIVAIWELNDLVRESIGVPLQIGVRVRSNLMAVRKCNGLRAVIPMLQCLRNLQRLTGRDAFSVDATDVTAGAAIGTPW